MGDLIKELVDRVLYANEEKYRVIEEGYQHQIKMLHKQILAHQDTIESLRKEGGVTSAQDNR